LEGIESPAMVRSIQDPISMMNKSGACTLREKERGRVGGGNGHREMCRADERENEGPGI